MVPPRLTSSWGKSWTMRFRALQHMRCPTMSQERLQWRESGPKKTICDILRIELSHQNQASLYISVIDIHRTLFVGDQPMIAYAYFFCSMNGAIELLGFVALVSHSADFRGWQVYRGLCTSEATTLLNCFSDFAAHAATTFLLGVSWFVLTFAASRSRMTHQPRNVVNSVFVSQLPGLQGFAMGSAHGCSCGDHLWKALVTG